MRLLATFWLARMTPSQNSRSEVVLPFGDEEPADSSDYSYEKNLPEPEPEPAAKVNEVFDLSDALAQTSIHLKRLGWNNQLSSQIFGGNLW